MKTRSLLYLAMVLGDLAVFLAFPILGSSEHSDTLSPATMVRNTVPFALAWLLLAPRLGAFPAVPPTTLRGTLVQVLKAWPVCGLAGLAMRSLVFGRPWAWSFVIIALLVQGLLLFVWRFALTLAMRRGTSRLV